MNKSPLFRGCFLLVLWAMVAGLTACDLASVDPQQDQDAAIIWQLIAERDSLRAEINALEDENLYLSEELETIRREVVPCELFDLTAAELDTICAMLKR